jgi:hypothetical protein
MHHCVRTYADRVARGCRAFTPCAKAAARGDAGAQESRAVRSFRAQIRSDAAEGACNAKPPAPVATAVAAFIDKANEIVLNRSREPSVAGDARPAVDPHLLQARQKIHGVCLAWIASQGAGAS